MDRLWQLRNEPFHQPDRPERENDDQDETPVPEGGALDSIGQSGGGPVAPGGGLELERFQQLRDVRRWRRGIRVGAFVHGQEECSLHRAIWDIHALDGKRWRGGGAFGDLRGAAPAYNLRQCTGPFFKKWF